MSPFNTLAIAEYTSKTCAKAALKNLAYHKVNFVSPIYLEYALKGFARKTVKEEAWETNKKIRLPPKKKIQEKLMDKPTR